MTLSAKNLFAAALAISLFGGSPALGAAPPAAAPAAAPKDPEKMERDLMETAKAMRESGRVQFNFRDLDIIQFIRFMSELLGENIVVSPGVRGTVSVVSPKPISISESRLVMLSALEMNGLSLQGMGGYSKVVPINAGPSSDNQVVKGQRVVPSGEQLVVQITPLRYVKAGFVIDPVKLGVPGVNLAPVNGGAGVMMTGRASLLNKAMKIIKALDAPDSIRAIKTVTMKYASPKLIEGHLNALSKEATSALASLVAIGDERSGKLIMVGTNASIGAALNLVATLDIPATTSNFHVYRLQNADAKTVAEQLGQVLAVAARLQPAAPAAAPAAGGGAAAAPPMPSTVVPDLSTNSLVFTATPEQYEAIKGVIEELDIQPKQVLLRGLIAEVNLSKLNSAGIDWAAWGGSAGGSALTGGMAQLGATNVPSEFMQWFREMTKKENVTTDANGNSVTTTNTEGMGLIYAYIKLLNQYNAINVLSMPRLMCTDNKESALQVGQVVPQLKGQLSDISNPAATQNSYEYKDTGLILKVTPHIRSGNLVGLDIEQTIEEVTSTPGSPTPTTSKRLIKTNVMVSNNETIILGGLIREVERTLKNRVPGLSYIPLLGNLFTSSERQREKIDLMVFLTPRIIETPKQATEATIEVTTGRDGFSLGEEATIRQYYNQFKEANKNQGFSRDLLHQDVVSADVISGDIKTGDLDSLLWPEKSPRDDGKSDKGKAASGAEPKEPDPKDSLPGYRKRGGN